MALPTIMAGTRMEETIRMSELIGEIYDAALDGSPWQRVLENACRHISGGDCAVPWAQDCLATGAECALTVLFDENAVPGLLERSAATASARAAWHDHQPANGDDGARQRLSLLAPHLRRAIAIRKLLDRHKAQTAALADTLDGLAAATFLVDEAARIVHANARGEALLAQATVLHAGSGALQAVDRKADKSLKDALAAAAAGETGIALPLPTADDGEWSTHVLPLGAGGRRGAGSRRPATIAVFARKAELDLRSSVETLARVHRLTQAEARVLLAFMEAGGLPEVAAKLGISEPTVRTHMQRIFGKIGVKRQVDLVRLVVSYSTPFVTRTG